MRIVNVKPYGFDKIYMEKDLIEDKLHQIIDQLNGKKISSVKFYLILLNETHLFYHENCWTCKILFASDDKIRKFTDGTKIKKLIM